MLRASCLLSDLFHVMPHCSHTHSVCCWETRVDTCFTCTADCSSVLFCICLSAHVHTAVSLSVCQFVRTMCSLLNCLCVCLSLYLSIGLFVLYSLYCAPGWQRLSVCLQVPAYRLKLPPKRLFPNPTPDFVEERRQQLDSYLQQLLQEHLLQGLQPCTQSCWTTVTYKQNVIVALYPSAGKCKFFRQNVMII